MSPAKAKLRPPHDADVAAFLKRVGQGDLAAVNTQLVETPALINAVGPHPFWAGRPQALHVAVEAQRWEMVQLLLRAGADIDGSNDQYAHWSPLMAAVAGQSADRARIKRALLARGATVGLGEALLMADDVRALPFLRRRPLPRQVPNEGSWLALARTPKAIDRLLALGASLTKRDRWATTPMESLSRQGKRGQRLVRHLAARGVAVDAECFARLGDRRTLASLCAANPKLLQRATVVKAAVDFGHRPLVTWLLDRGADPNARSRDRASHDTCLHSAAWNGDLPMVQLLLQRGADPLLRDDEHHRTPADWAEVALKVTNNGKCALVGARLRRAQASSNK